MKTAKDVLALVESLGIVHLFAGGHETMLADVTSDLIDHLTHFAPYRGAAWPRSSHSGC